jgi:ATP-dependent Clp protease protease subunit
VATELVTTVGRGTGPDKHASGAAGNPSIKLLKELPVAEEQQPSGPIEIAFVGDLTDHESDLTDKLLGVEPGGECTMFFDSPGGSPYCAMSLVSVMLLRRIQATGIVTGECSSAALWPFAACRRRFVTPYSVLLFHPMKWQSEEHVGLSEAAEWARHFGTLEGEMDRLLAELFGTSEGQLSAWIAAGRYVSGRELAALGLAELVDLRGLRTSPTNGMPGHLKSATPKRRAPAPARKRRGRS